MYSLGIDIGYSAVKISLIDEEKSLRQSRYKLHKGRVVESLSVILDEVAREFGLERVTHAAITGNGGKFLSDFGLISHVNEVAATVEACVGLKSGVEAIAEIGGQSAKYITGFAGRSKSGVEVSMNPSCASGTGSFLEEQMSRLELRIEDYSGHAARAESVPRIAGRCSVFAKTDITHHQQEGVPVEDILKGLAYATARNYRGAVMRKLTFRKPIMFVGGVALNFAVADALRDILKLEKDELTIPDNPGNMAALGAARLALMEGLAVDLEKVAASIEEASRVYNDGVDDLDLPALAGLGAGDSDGKHELKPVGKAKGCVDCYLGVDVGSTSTNLVLMDRERNILAFRYLRTRGNPVHAVTSGLRELHGEMRAKVNVVGAATTGSGRYMIGDLVGADVVKDEITAQAKAAVTLDPDVDTIFEIGGQDSKFVSLRDGVVADFQMNKVCAAGTGSFIEEQAKKLGVPVEDFGPLALEGESPAGLGERCTVFMESSVAANLSKGVNLENIASGLCYSIVKNYLNRVVGRKRVGGKILFQGGVAYNQGVVNAFRSVTGREIHVPPFFSVTGAFGAALLAQEEIGDRKTAFRGFDIRDAERIIAERKKSGVKVSNTDKFNRQVENLIFQGHGGELDAERKTVGMPRALFTYGMFPMFYAFFKELGLNVLLSDATDEETIRLAQKFSLEETCYPVKLINGHIAELIEKKVDYIFFPDLYTVPHPGSVSRQDYGCAYMQLAFKLVNRAMNLDGGNVELLAPTIAFSLGQEFMMKSFMKLGNQLGKSPEQTQAALQKGMKAFQGFEKRIEERASKTADRLDPDKKVFVIISKTYGVADPVLNMGIPGKLMDMGHQVVPFYDMPDTDLSQRHPNMYWPFGQHILEAAKVVRDHPNAYAIFLTHHGCGPDTVFTHYFREIMQGKPYLTIEVDEHSSAVGVTTRVEAFVNSLEALSARGEDGKAEAPKSPGRNERLKMSPAFNGLGKDAFVCLPNMYPYSDIARAILESKGFKARVLPPTTQSSLDIGREHTVTNEYFSLAALLGDVLREFGGPGMNGDRHALLLPQTEGAEVDGQYSRLLRSKLDEEGFGDVEIVSPFYEDLPSLEPEDADIVFLGLLAGDLILLADRWSRSARLKEVLGLIREGRLTLDGLFELALKIREGLGTPHQGKRVLAIGEPMVLFNDFLNNNTFKYLEGDGHRVVYAPFSEYLWSGWRDYTDQNPGEKSAAIEQSLGRFEQYIRAISDALGDKSPFEEQLGRLIGRADRTVGYYAGAFGRYRESKLLGGLENVDGAITVASMYENTAITLNVLHKGFEAEQSRPVLNLTFDGASNDNDASKIESFMYYTSNREKEAEMLKDEAVRHGCHGRNGRRRGGSSYRIHDPEDVFEELDLKSGDVFVDLGCGPGDYALRAATEVGRSGFVYAFDQRKEVVDELQAESEARKLLNLVTWRQDILKSLPLESGSVDVCLLSTVLHSIDLSAGGVSLFNEVRRILKPEGRLAVIECHKREMPFGPPLHVRLSLEEVEKAIEPFGLAKNGYRDLGYNYFVQFVFA